MGVGEAVLNRLRCYEAQLDVISAKFSTRFRQEKEHVIFLTLFCLFEKVSIVRNHKELRLWAPLRYAHNKTDMTQRVQFATNVLAS